MAEKPAGARFPVKEQILDDPVTGITFQFFAVPGNEEGPFRLRIFGNVPHVDHEFIFDRDGVIRGRETMLMRRHKPTWLTQVKRSKRDVG
jgi:hypothetical protein